MLGLLASKSSADHAYRSGGLGSLVILFRLQDLVERTLLGEALAGDHAGPELGDLGAQIRIANGRGHARSRGARQLDRRRAHAAGAAVDEQPLAGTKLRLREERVVRGREDLGHSPGGDQAEPARDAHQLTLMRDAQLGLRSSADNPHHLVSGRKAFRCGPQRGHLAGELHPGNVLRRSGRRWIQPATLHHVGAVQPGGMDAHEHLTRARLGVGVLLDDELVLADRDGAHGAKPSLII